MPGTVIRGLRPTKTGIGLDKVAWGALLAGRETINGKAERMQVRSPSAPQG